VTAVEHENCLDAERSAYRVHDSSLSAKAIGDPANVKARNCVDEKVESSHAMDSHAYVCALNPSELGIPVPVVPAPGMVDLVVHKLVLLIL